MALSPSDFGKAVVAAGLLPADDLRVLLASSAAGMRPKDAAALAKLLVERGTLTRYQADELLAGRGPGLVLGDYIVQDKIGAGGMGQVLKAEHRKMGRTVALKLMSAVAMRDEAAIKRFHREVRAAARLEHPNIVTAHAAGEANGMHYLVMQCVEGSDLSGRVKKEGPLSVDLAMDCICQSARGLAYAHSEGIIHRDIKPANLLLDMKGVVKILDMGLARIDGGDVHDGLTGTEQVLGTVDYMSPEQAISTRDCDARSDIYSLGCTLWYLLTGAKMYTGDSAIQRLMQHREAPLPSLLAARDDIPWALEKLFHKMVAKQPGDRWQAMDEVVHEIEHIRGDPESRRTSGLDEDTNLGQFFKTLGGKESSRLGTKVKAAAGKSSVENGDTRDHSDSLEVHKPAGGLNPPWKNPKILMGAGAAAILLLLLGVWVIVRDKDGNEVAKVKVPDGGAIKVQEVEQSPFAKPAKQLGVVPKADSPFKAGSPPGKLFINDPAFQAWMKTVATLPVEKQVEAVSKKLMELNPGFNGKMSGYGGNDMPKIENGVVTELGFTTDNVLDLSPVRALPGLKALRCGGRSAGSRGKLSDLSPLQGMKLTWLICNANPSLSDLSPLKGLPLTILQCNQSKVSDLSLLQGMPLTTLNCDFTSVSDLSPLKGMPLTTMRCDSTPVSDLSPLEDCKSLKTLNSTMSKVTPAGVAVLQKALPNCKIEWDDPAKAATQPNQPWNTPAFQAWVKATQSLPADKQIEAVSKKLMELNPGFDGVMTDYDGKGKPRIENGVVTQLGFVTFKVTDISPVRALVGFKRLGCYGISPDEGKFSDLSPLQGMQLTHLNCDGTRVTDLSPLQNMSLARLDCSRTQVSDLSPLKGMRLASVDCHSTMVDDLSPLQQMQMDSIFITPRSISKGLDVIRKMRSLKMIGVDSSNKWPPDEFWKKYDAGEFGKPTTPTKLAYLDPAFQQWVQATQALPAEQQIEAVSQKLMELNPGFDGKLTDHLGKGLPKFDNGVLTDLGFVTDKVTDISPVRALAGLKALNCQGSDIRSGKLSDLSPLEGMKLTHLICGFTQVFDLSPLEGMPLYRLHCQDTKVSDLSPLKGMPLVNLLCFTTPVFDLSPLEGMPLLILDCRVTQVSDLLPLEKCKALKSVNATQTKVTPASVAALQKALPGCKIEWDDPANATVPLPATPVGPQPPLAKAPFDAVQAKAHQTAWAMHLGTTVESTNSIGAKMILIPPGEFQMGSTPEQVEVARKMAKDDGISATTDHFRRLAEEMPQHRVSITQPFLMGSTEVTVGQFRKFVELSKYLTEAEQYGFGNSSDKVMPDKTLEADKGKNWKTPGYDVTDNSPVTQITWNDAVVYCNWLSAQEKLQHAYRQDDKGGWVVGAGLLPLGEAARRADEGNPHPAANAATHSQTERVKNGYRLSTEAEWEYACRAGTTTQYSFGDDYGELPKYGWHNVNAAGKSHPVGTLLPNPFGLFDMHGNAIEWCQDWYDGKWYEKSPPSDPIGPASVYRHVLRGGSLLDKATSCRNASRNDYAPSQSSRHSAIGFRCVRLLDAMTTATAPAVASTTPTKLWESPDFQQWMKTVAAMPAEEQVEAVSKKLMELNPGFDGRVTGEETGSKPKVEGGVVTRISFVADKVIDISPVRALAGLRALSVYGTKGKVPFSDLSPLEGMSLSYLHCSSTAVSNLSPLKGMPLTGLLCGNTNVADLSLVHDCSSLKYVYLKSTKVTPASVAALQEVLPNCKIEWDDPAKATTAQPAASGTK